MQENSLTAIINSHPILGRTYIGEFRKIIYKVVDTKGKHTIVRHDNRVAGSSNCFNPEIWLIRNPVNFNRWE